MREVNYKTWGYYRYRILDALRVLWLIVTGRRKGATFTHYNGMGMLRLIASYHGHHGHPFAEHTLMIYEKLQQVSPETVRFYAVFEKMNGKWEGFLYIFVDRMNIARIRFTYPTLWERIQQFLSMSVHHEENQA
jgi:hypothetical protein